MKDKMIDLYRCESLNDIKNWLKSDDTTQSEWLKNELNRLQNYQNAVEWNKLVLLCEAITIRGWSNVLFDKMTPVEAYCGKGLSGSFETSLMTADWKKQAGSWHDWSKKGDTFVVYKGADSQDYGIAKLNTQRNNLPTNPFKIGRFITNCQLSVTPFVAEVSSLNAILEAQLQPHLYGDGFYYAKINTHFSSHDWPGHASVLSQYFHDANDIPAGLNNAWVEPHLKFGKLSTRRNRLCWAVDIFYTKQWGELPLQTQKQSLVDDLQVTFAEFEARLVKKKVDYNTQLAVQHANTILQKWLMTKADDVFYKKIQAEVDEAIELNHKVFG